MFNYHQFSCFVASLNLGQSLASELARDIFAGADTINHLFSIKAKYLITEYLERTMLFTTLIISESPVASQKSKKTRLYLIPPSEYNFFCLEVIREIL